MSSRTITLNLPEQIYHRAERAARRLDRSINEVLIKAVDVALPSEAELPVELTRKIEALIFLNDAALWGAVRDTLSAMQSARLEELVGESKSRMLTSDEQKELDALIEDYQRIMLVRAKATVLLKTRGYDVSEVTTSLPKAA